MMSERWEDILDKDTVEKSWSAWPIMDEQKAPSRFVEVPWFGIRQTQEHGFGLSVDFIIRRDVRIGEHSYSICHELEYLKESAERLQYILDRPEDWDECGAVKASPSSVHAAMNFLLEYAEGLINAGYDRRKILPPEINSRTDDGSIDFYWSVDKVKLMIHFTALEGRPIAAYFGMFANRKEPIEGWIYTDTPPKPYFIEWLANVST
ncbi:MAG TPA: hypothetical protein PLN54_09580 [Flavobacteriales bacterium]|nr:hypothetical protein [Flavobacteriales bacterium]